MRASKKAPEKKGQVDPPPLGLPIAEPIDLDNNCLELRSAYNNSISRFTTFIPSFLKLNISPTHFRFFFPYLNIPTSSHSFELYPTF